MQYQKQQGFILLMTLICIASLAFLVLATSKSSIMQTKLSGHFEHMNTVFNESRSELEAQVDFFTAAGDFSRFQTIKAGKAAEKLAITAIQIPLEDNSPITKTLKIDYLGEKTPPPGFSLTEFSGQTFQWSVTSAIGHKKIQTQSEQALGITVVAPKQ